MWWNMPGIPSYSEGGRRIEKFKAHLGKAGETLSKYKQKGWVCS
jgi:hypothetical protein